MNKNKIKNIIIIVLLIGFIIARFRPNIDFGYCMDNNGNGILLNRDDLSPIDEYYNYIKYDDNLNGKYIYSFYLLNPFTNYYDDIIFRYDFISHVSRETLPQNIILTYGHIYNY